MKPLVSIVIPVFNGSDYLREAIDSALAQTYQPIEVLVVNDGSQDEGATERVALSYGSSIQYFSKENGGVASALNLAIEKMRGKYFSWLSHDDLYFPEKISRQVEFIENALCQKTIVYSDAVAFTEDPNVVHEIVQPKVSSERFRYFLTTSSSLHGCTLLIPRSAFAECGTFNENLRTTQDYDMWFRLAENYNFVHIATALVKARQHAAQGSITMKATALEECNNLLSSFVEALKPEDAPRNTPISLVYAAISENLERRGFVVAARRASELCAQSMSQESFAIKMAVATILFNASVKRQIRRIKTVAWRYLLKGR